MYSSPSSSSPHSSVDHSDDGGRWNRFGSVPFLPLASRPPPTADRREHPNNIGLQRYNSLPVGVLTGFNSDHHNDAHKTPAHSSATTTTFGMAFPVQNPTTLVFSPATGNQSKRNTDGGINIRETQIQFGPSQTTLQMASPENMMDNIPGDNVICKARAKRGCATHPRSIAERERRTRISGKLKKLQDVVPNMDKQTSYADMLELAAQHIKGLQKQVQKLNMDLEHCSCGCKQSVKLHHGRKK